eukprot:2983189-Amphidinium_carterae.1
MLTEIGLEHCPCFNEKGMQVLEEMPREPPKHMLVRAPIAAQQYPLTGFGEGLVALTICKGVRVGGLECVVVIIAEEDSDFVHTLDATNPYLPP